MNPQEPKTKKERDPNNHKLPKELQDCLKYLVKKYEDEDGWVRKQQLKLWKRNEEFWHGIQFVFWSESRQDWFSPTEYRWFQEDEGREGTEGPFYDYVINIYKAHGESIIAALGAQIPTVRFPPDDAEDDDDIQTSRTYSKIADLIQRHNQAKILQLMSLFTLWNQGIIAWYHAPKADKEFGITHIENFKKELCCEQCEKTFPVEDEEDLLSELHKCPDCGAPLSITTVLEGFQESPKTRVVIEQYGGIHVKVPYWATKQQDCSYLIKAMDRPKPLLKYLYPHIADEIDDVEYDSQSYEKMTRTPSAFTSFSRADDNRDLGTHRQIWMRTWALEGLPKERSEEKKKLYKMFPDGIYVCLVGNTYCESRNEDMDKYWTIGKVGLSTYIHADALGQPLVSIQELRNVLVNLTAETVEQGIGSGFADPDVLNFNVYSKHEARPGMIYPARPRPGQNLASSFFEAGRATLSQEVGPFQERLDVDAQFAVGDFPSLYGGPADGNSRTLGEYQQSRTMALQRLSIAWALFVVYWAKLMEKCVHLYVENMIDDEKFTIPDQDKKDSYVNVWIRKADMTGHVGEVEPEGADSFPVSTPQKQSLFFKLVQLNNQAINTALFAPQNRRIVADLLAFPELEIPGEDQRMLQCAEIVQMVKTGQPIPIDPMLDDATIHIDTLRFFLAGIRGMDLKASNPTAYAAIEQHLKMHLDQNKQSQEQELNQQIQAKEAMDLQKELRRAKLQVAKQQNVQQLKQQNGIPS